MCEIIRENDDPGSIENISREEGYDFYITAQPGKWERGLSGLNSVI